MAKRVSASQRASERIEQLLNDLPEDGGMRDALLLGVRKLIEEALEAGGYRSVGTRVLRAQRGHAPRPSKRLAARRALDRRSKAVRNKDAIRLTPARNRSLSGPSRHFA